MTTNWKVKPQRYKCTYVETTVQLETYSIPRQGALGRDFRNLIKPLKPMDVQRPQLR